MATLFTPPRYTPIDGNGRAMPSSKLYFFQTGTSTPLDTYSDAGLTTANANPVVADANGLFGPIYLGTSSDYKVIFKTSADVTVWTVDPYFAASSGGHTVVSDADYAATISDKTIAYTSISAARSVTLPSAATYSAGSPLTVVDESGQVTSALTISLLPAGSDTIDGNNANISAAYGSIQVESNGSAQWTIVKPSIPVLRGYLAGLTLSNDGTTPNTKIDVAAGMCADSTNARMMNVAAGTIDCGTTGANGLDTGSLANSTWYHVWAIGKVSGVTALLASTSATAPTMPTGYTLKRRLGSLQTDGSAHLKTFVQDGDTFQWVTLVSDISASNPGTSAVSRTLSTPLGVRVQAWIQVMLANAETTGSVVYAYVSDLSTTDSTPSASLTDTSAAIAAASGTIQGAVVKYVYTNTSSQVRSRISGSTANITFKINTLGWVDRRGRDA